MGLNVLIVDDDMINRMLLKALLKKNSRVSNVIEAENGSDALDKAKEVDSIDIILLDIMMPILNGVEFLKIFRSDMSNSHIPVVVLTTDDTKKTEVFDNGANDFVRKPIIEKDLTRIIDQWT
jgi:putative two-component system response regulator